MEEMTYEKAMEKLAGIVKKLENGGGTLDESVELFKEGAALSKFCEDMLSSAEQKIISLDEVAEKDD